MLRQRYQKFNFEERTFELGAGHFGNGISVYNRAREVHGDYEKIAHIDRQRKVTWYIQNPLKEVQDYVDSIVKGPNVSASATQDWMKVFDEDELSTSKRNDLPDSDFVFPKDRRYPINDIEHARNALARVSQHGSPDEKSKVKAAVKRKYPSIDVSD